MEVFEHALGGGEYVGRRVRMKLHVIAVRLGQEVRAVRWEDLLLEPELPRHLAACSLYGLSVGEVGGWVRGSE